MPPTSIVAPPASAQQTPATAQRPAWLPFAVVAGAVVLLVGGFLVLSGDDEKASTEPAGTATTAAVTTSTEAPAADTTLAGVPGEIFLEPATGVGPTPFTPSVDVTPPDVVEQVPGQPLAPGVPFPGDAQGAPSSTGVIQSVPGNAPGLYGGTRDRTSCDPVQLVTFLEANPEKASAWAAVHQIQPTEISTFVAMLTPVLLRTDTRVTNFGFIDGKAPARQVVLQAGTAVLIDEFGVPRVRCFCGNPLREPQPEPTPTYTGDAWPGFDPAVVTVVAPAPSPIDELVLIDVVSADPFLRPTGTDGTQDAAAPSDALTPTTTAAPTTTSVPPVNITATGTVGVSSEFASGEFPVGFAFDGRRDTSWFSAGDADTSCQPITPGVSCSELIWTSSSAGDVLLTTIDTLNNSQHPDFPTGFGFGSVTVVVTDVAGAVVFQQTIQLPGEDPDVSIAVGVRGHSVRLVFEGHDAPDCGGISELIVSGQP